MSDYAPDSFVYVDPDTKSVVSLVEWDKDGNAIPKEWPYVSKKQESEDVEDEKPKFKRKPRKRYYPWGSYKTMCKLYKLEGKVKDKDTEDYIPLNTAIDKLQEEPYWS
tara:strand:+ start:384 stop:707 length:324 start_codon:yes stop_codon:yes gene_type:complete